MTDDSPAATIRAKSPTIAKITDMKRYDYRWQKEKTARHELSGSLLY